MKTFSTYQIKTGKKDIERRVLYAYRQERYNVEFLMMKKRFGWLGWFYWPGEIRYARSYRKFHWLKFSLN